MALQIRRGTQSEANAVVFAIGELVYTTDTQKLYVGDGITQGGVDIMANMEGAVSSVNGQVGAVELDTSNITENNNLYYTNQRALDAIGNDLTRTVEGQSPHAGISFVYNANHITASVDPGSFTGLQSVQEDTNPLLGGDLSLNSHSITGTGSIGITGTIVSTGTSGVLTINGTTLTSGDNNLYVGTSTARSTLTFRSNSTSSPMTVYEGLTAGLATGNGVTAKAARAGTTIVQGGDLLYSASIEGYNGSDYQLSSIFLSAVDPNGTVNASTVPGLTGLITFTDGNQANYKGLLVNRNGFVTINRPITYDSKAQLDVNGFMKLQPQPGAPASAEEGMIVIADRVTWDPASKGSGGSYPVYYDGSAWHAFY